MKNSVFHIPGVVRVEYQRHREGPKEVFILWTPNTARSFRSADDVRHHHSIPDHLTAQLSAWLTSVTDMSDPSMTST